MAEGFSCFKTTNRKTKCKKGIFVCLVGGVFLAELSFQTESYKGQDRADCCISITLLFFWCCPENCYTCFWTYKSNFEKNIWWMQEMAIVLLLLAIPWQRCGLNCVFKAGRYSWMTIEMLFWDFLSKVLSQQVDSNSDNYIYTSVFLVEINLFCYTLQNVYHSFLVKGKHCLIRTSLDFTGLWIRPKEHQFLIILVGTAGLHCLTDQTF